VDASGRAVMLKSVEEMFDAFWKDSKQGRALLQEVGCFWPHLWSPDTAVAFVDICIACTAGMPGALCVLWPCRRMPQSPNPSAGLQFTSSTASCMSHIDDISCCMLCCAVLCCAAVVRCAAGPAGRGPVPD
jgi:hypothetical protein